MLKVRWVRALLGLGPVSNPVEQRELADRLWEREKAVLDEAHSRHLALVAATLLGPARGIGTPGLRTPAEAARFREGVEMAERLHNEARIFVAQQRRANRVVVVELSK